jgi:hypothetical protein
MADPGNPPTQAATEQPTAATDYPAGGESQQGVNMPLLLVLLLILVLVSISNVWLRRRAEREGDEPAEGDGR